MEQSIFQVRILAEALKMLSLCFKKIVQFMTAACAGGANSPPGSITIGSLGFAGTDILAKTEVLQYQILHTQMGSLMHRPQDFS